MATNSRRTVIWGAGGFAGAELLRLVVAHRKLKLAAALSSTHAGRPVADLHPGLAGWTELSFARPEDFDWCATTRGSWTIFTALGHGESMKRIPEAASQAPDGDVQWIDLSGDYRLASAQAYEKWYGQAHSSADLVGTFVYGLPELNRERIRCARRTANPGCFATGAQLALLPAAAGGRVAAVAVDGKTGSSGAGAQPRETTHHPYRMNNFQAYKLEGHRHFAEIEAGWRQAGGGRRTEISFVPQMAPMVRGIFTTAHLFFDQPVDPDECGGWYRSYYADHPFVRIVEGSPSVADVWGSNRCDLSVTVVGRHAVVCTAIDNLIKGAAGQAIQNANLMSGWDEREGLTTPAPRPV